MCSAAKATIHTQSINGSNVAMAVNCAIIIGFRISAQQEKCFKLKLNMKCLRGSCMHAFVQFKSDGIINAAIGIVTSNGKPYSAVHYTHTHIAFLLLLLLLVYDKKFKRWRCCLLRSKMIFSVLTNQRRMLTQKARARTLHWPLCKRNVSTTNKHIHKLAQRNQKTNKHEILCKWKSKKKQLQTSNSKTKRLKFRNGTWKMIWLCHVKSKFLSYFKWNHITKGSGTFIDFETKDMALLLLPCSTVICVLVAATINGIRKRKTKKFIQHINL